MREPCRPPEVALVRVLHDVQSLPVGQVGGRVSACKSPAEKKVSNFGTLCLTSLVWKLQSWQASGAKRFHRKPPLIGLGAHRRCGGGRVQTLAIIRFLFGRALSASRGYSRAALR